MRKILVLILAGLFFLTSCSSTPATPEEISQDPAQLDDICGVTGTEDFTGVMSHDSWVNVGLRGEDTDVYMWIHNHTLLDDALMGISSDAAEKMEIHRNQMSTEGEMLMIPETSFFLPSKYMVELLPGSYHLMLIGLTRDLKVGEEITLTFHFDTYLDVSENIPVKDW